MLCAFLLVTHLAFISPAGASAPAKDDQLKPGLYRVKVEVILDPSGDNAVYRAQVWTVGEQDVHFCLGGGAIAVEGNARPEPGGKLFRTDWVVIARLMNPPKQNAKQRVLERIYECNGGSSIALGAYVDPEAPLKDLARIKAETTTAKLETRVLIGQLADHKLEVVAGPPAKK